MGQGRDQSARSTDEPLSAVIRHLDAFNQRDVDGLCAGLANDVVFATGQDVVTRRDQVRGFLEQALSGPAELVLELRRAIVQDGNVACELSESITLEGTTHQESIAAFYVTRDGLLTDVKVYREGSADLPHNDWR